MSDSDYDVIIIGSGFAGSLIAKTLAERGLTIAVLEAGGSLPEERHIRQSLREAFANSDEEEVVAPFRKHLPLDERAHRARPYVSKNDVTTGRFDADYLRLVGGTGLAWLGTALRMSPSDFRMHSLYGQGADWPISYDELEPWYCLAEEELGVAGDGESDLVLGAVRSKTHPMPPIAQTYSDRYVATRTRGLKFNDQLLQVLSTPQARNSLDGYNGRPQCEGYGSCVPLCPVGAKYDPLVHLRQAVLSGADLFEGATVTELEAEETGYISAARIIRPNGSEHILRARLFVVAANAIETPKLLLQSKGFCAGGLANESGLVGRYLMEHPQKYSCALLPDPIFAYRGPQSTAGIEHVRDGPFRKQRAAFRTALRNDGWRIANGAPLGEENGFVHGTILDFVDRRGLVGSSLRSVVEDEMPRHFALQSVVEVLPNIENSVSLSRSHTDGTGRPRAEIHFRIGQYERDGIVAASRLHEAVFSALGCRAEDVYLNLRHDPAEPDGPGSHIMGTTVMGDEPKNSVVDRNCQSHAHANLFIVGSSVFPTGSTANPTLTICALALRAAHFIQHSIARALNARV